jgi:hypothetical protein
MIVAIFHVEMGKQHDWNTVAVSGFRGHRQCHEGRPLREDDIVGGCVVPQPPLEGR